MNKYPTSGNIYQKKIEDVGEHLWKNQNSIGNDGMIPWEKFTTSYMKYRLPKDDLERIYWCDHRSLWCTHINTYFSSSEYGAWMFVIPTKGVILLLGDRAVLNAEAREIKKTCNTIGNLQERFEALEVNFPESQKGLTFLVETTKDMMFSMNGRIDMSRRLPRNTKETLKRIISKRLNENK